MHGFTGCGKNRLYQRRYEPFHRFIGYVSSMRGDDEQQAPAFSYIMPEQRIPQDHPLRAIRTLVDRALREQDLHFYALYARRGRRSIPPERLLRALLLMALYSIRSEGQLMEQINFNLLFRWFVGLNPDDAVWDASVFTKNRERLMAGDVSQRLLRAVVEQAGPAGLLSEEHFTVDGTLLQAWASRRSFRPKDPPPAQGSGARGRKLLRDTHESSTDPEARLFKRATAAEAVPSYLGHVITENRHGLVVAACATQASSKAERAAALQMLDAMPPRASRITLGADKGYQEEEFLRALRRRGVLPHVAEYKPSKHWKNGLREEERQSPGFALSQLARKLVEQVFGWGKNDRPLRRMKLRALRRIDWLFRLVMVAHNLVRLPKLIAAQ